MIFGANSLSECYTFLTAVYKDVLDESGAVIAKEVDLTQSIYIDWGSFINAVINFFLIAFVLFVIVKLINKFREENKDLKNKLKEGKLTKEQKKELRANGIKIKDTVAVEAYFAEKKRIAEEAAAAAAAEAAEKARLDREANPTTEDLLKSILAELKKNG
jgi:large-conductance mechanosensitive channel